MLEEYILELGGLEISTPSVHFPFGAKKWTEVSGSLELVGPVWI
jgi:hypothetical protein